MLEIPRSGDTEVVVGGQRLELTQVDRPMWPVAGLTKADLLDYYARVAPVLLPHVTGRPLRVVRFPDGVHLRGVVDSDLADAPRWMATHDRRPVISDLASLLWVVNLAAVELHVPLGSDPSRPCCVQFDVEPGAGRALEDCCTVALRLRAALADDGLVAQVKTSGAFGLHVAVPLNGGASGDQALEYAQAVTQRLAGADPDLVTGDARRTSRARRVLVDWRPNAPARTSVAPYSLRAMLPGPGVSAPVGWSDVEAGSRGELDALLRSPQDVLAAAQDGEDRWRPVLDAVQPLPRG